MLVPLSDWKIAAMTYAAAKTLGLSVAGAAMNTIASILNTITGLVTLLLDDLNRYISERDGARGMYQIPLHTHNHVRSGPREFVLSTIASGAPLTFQPNTLVTKVLFNTSGSTPEATGVAYLQGQSLYQAGKLQNTIIGQGTASNARLTYLRSPLYWCLWYPRQCNRDARGDSFSRRVQHATVTQTERHRSQRAELKSFNIPVVVDLPGVGTNLQDRYENSIILNTTTPFSEFANCTFAYPGIPDPCYSRWQSNAAIPGSYASNGIPFGITNKVEYGLAELRFPK